MIFGCIFIRTDDLDRSVMRDAISALHNAQSFELDDCGGYSFAVFLDRESAEHLRSVQVLINELTFVKHTEMGILTMVPQLSSILTHGFTLLSTGEWSHLRTLVAASQAGGSVMQVVNFCQNSSYRWLVVIGRGTVSELGVVERRLYEVDRGAELLSIKKPAIQAARR